MALLLSPYPAVARMDQESEDALKDTQDLLTSQQRLSEAARNDPEARKALDQVRALTGNDPRMRQQIEQIASDVFTKMTRDANGDPAAISEQLAQGLKNPQGMMNSFTPEQQHRIQEMGRQIDAQRRQPSSASPSSAGK